MRQRATWLVVAALTSVGLLAVLDAVRGGSQASPGQDAPTTPSTSSAALADLPLFAGVLYYTDDDCRLQAVRLPDLAPVPAPVWSTCRFALSPDGSTPRLEGTVWNPEGSVRAFAAGSTISITTARGEGGTFRGSTPAWRPDGALTYVHEGELRTWPEGDTLLTNADLRVPTAEVDAGFGRITRFRVEETAWLSETRVAAVLRVDRARAPTMRILAFYEGTSGWVALAGGGISDVSVDPSGEFVAVRTGAPPGFAIVDHAGLSVQSPPLTTFNAFAWAPEGGWAAVATRANVFVFRPRREEMLVRRLPLAAEDVAWR